MTPAVASEHEWVGVDACEVVMDAIFRKMCCNNTDYDYADARAKFDDLMDVFKAGHMRNVESMATHPGHREEFDKFIFIFNKDGFALPQVWHVDARGPVASSFILLTDSVPTDVFPTVTAYTLEAAWAIIGIPERFWAAAAAFAKAMRVAKAAENIDIILVDTVPLMSSDWEAFVKASSSNGTRAKAGYIVSTRGAYPHRGTGTDGDFRLVLLITSYPTSCDRPEEKSEYDKDLQHHRSQACLYWWCFLEALKWLSVDRVESPDADVHWVDHPRTQKVVKAFLAKHATAWASWADVPADAKTSWARHLACAYHEDEISQNFVKDWPLWVPDELRLPLTAKERARLR